MPFGSFGGMVRIIRHKKLQQYILTDIYFSLTQANLIGMQFDFYNGFLVFVLKTCFMY